MTTSLHPGGPLVMLDDLHMTLGSAAGPVNILRGISLEIGAGETVSVRINLTNFKDYLALR